MGDSRHLPQYRPVRSPLMSMGPSLDEERRRHRTARLIATSSLAGVVGVVLLVWVIGMLGREVVSATRADGSETVRAGAGAVVQQTGPPTPQTLAEAVVEEGSAGLRLQLPIRREAVTGLGFMPRRAPGVIELQPSGTRANTSWLRRATQRFLSTSPPGDLAWYRLDEGTPSMVLVGAVPGTEVYSPIDGKVQAIIDNEIDGEVRGAIIWLQPVGDAQTVVVLRNIEPSDDIAVGRAVSRSVTKLGTVRDMEGVLEAPLAAYTHDSGSGIDMHVLRTQVPGSANL